MAKVISKFSIFEGDNYDSDDMDHGNVFLLIILIHFEKIFHKVEAARKRNFVS